MKDFLFKILDIDTSSSEKIKEEIAIFSKNRENHIVGQFSMLDVESTLSLLPTISKWLEANKLEVIHIAYISVNPTTIQQAHIDSGESTLAINFPVINCNNVTTEFFKLESNDLTIRHSKGTNLPYYHFDNNGKDAIASFSLTQPTLLNIKMPHSVVNNTELERISLSFRFKKDPWHLI